MRALGLEPSLVRGKSPVPYQSGVTRVVGREGIEPPMSDDGWFTASCAAMARPTHARSVWQPTATCDASVVVKVLLAALDARRVEAGSEGVEPSARGVGDRSATTGSSPSENDAHDVVRVMKCDGDQTMSVVATSAYRACDLSQLPDSPASIPYGVVARVGTRARRSSTRMVLGVSVRRCVCVP